MSGVSRERQYEITRARIEEMRGAVSALQNIIVTAETNLVVHERAGKAMPGELMGTLQKAAFDYMDNLREATSGLVPRGTYRSSDEKSISSIVTVTRRGRGSRFDRSRFDCEI